MQSAVLVYRHVRQELLQRLGRKDMQDMVMAGMLPSLAKAELMSLGLLPPALQGTEPLYRCAPTAASRAQRCCSCLVMCAQAQGSW